MKSSAMHIPDGFLAAPVWGGLWVVSAPAVVAATRRAQRDLDESKVPLMGVLGAFVFAAQMVNFPLGAGTSGHLLGGTLLAAALGPAPAIVVMTAILTLQALVFQDGGLLALGANLFNMALIGTLAGYWPWRALAGGRFARAGLFAGGFCSVLVCALLCLAELSVSGVHFGAAAMSLAGLHPAGLAEGSGRRRTTGAVAAARIRDATRVGWIPGGFDAPGRRAASGPGDRPGIARTYVVQGPAGGLRNRAAGFGLDQKSDRRTERPAVDRGRVCRAGPLDRALAQRLNGPLR
jgi:cobalt/nickel transport system permease protein